MKTKINFKKTILSILSLVMMSVLVGCEKEISIIVNKKLEATVKLKNLADESTYFQKVIVDLSLATDDVDKIATAVIKSFELTLNDDYKNTVTQEKFVTSFFTIYFVVGEPDYTSDGKPAAGPQDDIRIFNNFTGGGNFLFTVGTTNSYILPNSVSLKKYIKDNKVALLIGYSTTLSGAANAPTFNDSDFSLNLKVEAQLQVDL